MSLTNFKYFIFLIFFISKVIMIISIFIFEKYGGFTSGESIRTITLMAPLFSVYTSVMVKDFSDNPFKKKITSRGRNLSISFTLTSVFVVLIYIIGIFFILYNKYQNPSKMDSLVLNLSLAESVFGIYIGTMIIPIFRLKND